MAGTAGTRTGCSPGTPPPALVVGLSELLDGGVDRGGARDGRAGTSRRVVHGGGGRRARPVGRRRGARALRGAAGRRRPPVGAAPPSDAACSPWPGGPAPPRLGHVCVRPRRGPTTRSSPSGTTTARVAGRGTCPSPVECARSSCPVLGGDDAGRPRSEAPLRPAGAGRRPASTSSATGRSSWRSPADVAAHRTAGAAVERPGRRGGRSTTEPGRGRPSTGAPPRTGRPISSSWPRGGRCTRPVSVIAGGPGTGKTHTVARILAAALRLADGRGPVLRVALAAPTGKAAARMTRRCEAQVAALVGRGPSSTGVAEAIRRHRAHHHPPAAGAGRAARRSGTTGRTRSRTTWWSSTRRRWCRCRCWPGCSTPSARRPGWCWWATRSSWPASRPAPSWGTWSARTGESGAPPPAPLARPGHRAPRGHRFDAGLGDRRAGPGHAATATWRRC